MSIIKKFIFTFLLLIIPITISLADIKKVGKFKDWETLVIQESSGKVCFAQSIPVLQAPKTNKRDARLFVTFRPNEKISNEISATAGYEFNKNNSVLATSGNNKFKFDIKQQGFAWMTSNKKEKIMVKIMKKGSRIMVTGYNEKGSQTLSVCVRVSSGCINPIRLPESEGTMKKSRALTCGYSGLPLSYLIRPADFPA